MRILVVNKFLWPKGGSERVMFDLIGAYERAGHEVVPFSMSSSKNVASEYAEYFVSEVNYEDVRSASRLSAAARAIYSREAKGKLSALVRKVRPDVAHLHNFHHQLSPSIVDALREAGISTIHTMHDYKLICPAYSLYTGGQVCERCKGGRFHNVLIHRCVRDSVSASLIAYVETTLHRMRRTLERGVRFFVSPSSFLAQKLAEFGFPVERVRHVPNGVDPSAFDVAASPGEGFLFAGRLDHRKGLPTLLKALERTPSVRLTIAGSGPFESHVRQEATRRGVGRVKVLGHLAREELLARIRASRALVLPSESYENAPIAALEALASGVPVVGSKIGGIPEIVRDGKTGLLFDPGDAVGLARCLERLEADSDLAAKLGREGREAVENEFSLEVQAERMLRLFEESLADSA